VPTDLRIISLRDVSEQLETIAQLALSSKELGALGIPMSERDWWDGLGHYSATYIELPTGEQFLLRRLDDAQDALDVFARLSGEPREQMTRLLTALDLPAERVTWEVPLDTWSDLQEHAKNYRARD
jgi:hypothetical protein